MSAYVVFILGYIVVVIEVAGQAVHIPVRPRIIPFMFGRNSFKHTRRIAFRQPVYGIAVPFLGELHAGAQVPDGDDVGKHIPRYHGVKLGVVRRHRALKFDVHARTLPDQVYDFRAIERIVRKPGDFQVLVVGIDLLPAVHVRIIIGGILIVIEIFPASRSVAASGHGSRHKPRQRQTDKCLEEFFHSISPPDTI